jgi:hypothetical protein
MIIMSILMLIPLVNGQGEDLELEDNEFMISVDPSDLDQGVLEISGTFTPPDLGLIEQVTVILDSNITEVRDGEPTGRYWHSNIYWAGAAGAATKVFGRNDGPTKFTVELDPATHDPQTDTDITVPWGIALDVWGDLVVKASMTGAVDGTITDSAKIYPEEYHLVNITTGTQDARVSAGTRLHYNITIMNSGNMDSDIVFEIPLLEELESEDWNITMDSTEFLEMAPGEKRETHLTMEAPDIIPRSEIRILTMMAETLQIDPDTNDPESSTEITINLNLERSDITPKPDDDPDPVNNTTDGDDNTGDYILGGVVGIVLVLTIIGILLVVIFRGRGGDGEEEEIVGSHEAMYRI